MARGLRIPSSNPGSEDTTDAVETEEETNDEAAEVPPQVTVTVAPPKVPAHEKLVLVKPRVSRESFRCGGKYYTTIAGKEQRVPAGVAEHMEQIGVL